MRNTGMEEAQAGIKIAGRNINNLRYADDITLMAESEEELKILLMKVKEDWRFNSYMTVYMLEFPFSQIIPPSPSPSESKSPLYTSVSFFLWLTSNLTAF